MKHEEIAERIRTRNFPNSEFKFVDGRLYVSIDALDNAITEALQSSPIKQELDKRIEELSQPNDIDMNIQMSVKQQTSPIHKKDIYRETCMRRIKEIGEEIQTARSAVFPNYLLCYELGIKQRVLTELINFIPEQSFPCGEFSEEDMIKFADNCNGHTTNGDYQKMLKQYRKRKEG